LRAAAAIAFVTPRGEPSLIRSTTRALLEPKRLIPILLVSGSLVAAQSNYSQDALAVPLGVVMCILFVLVAPVSWRVLFPEGLEFSHGAIRLLLYGTIGAGVVLSLGAAVPKILDMGPTFLTARPILLICTALFLVGGWGLGRDIGMEEILHREKARAAALARAAEMSQLLALRSHLDPHFLFNTLNAIAEWCRQDPETAERAVFQLSDVLRAVLAGVRSPAWPLERELDLVRTVFSLHLLRDPNLFELSVQVQPELSSVPIPPMLILPLAENAVKHGPGAGHRGSIALSVARHGESVRVTLENPGPYRGPREGSDGLPTLKKRLALAYGVRASLEIASAGNATRANLEVPLSGPIPGVIT